MKVLHVNTHDVSGGAARAAYRLHQALLSVNLDSRMLVQYKKSDDQTVSMVASDKVGKALALIRPAIDSVPLRFYRNKTPTLFSPAWLWSNRLISKINEMAPDIVHLHWICGGMVRIEDLPKIKAPIFWSLHDMWAFTGGCHYNEGCEGYLDKCNTCKVLGSNGGTNLSRWIWKRKHKTYKKIPNLTLIGLSNWLRKCAATSKLLSHSSIYCLPNPIDTSKYKPIEKDIARKLWNLPLNKKLVLFGAMSATSDPRKGYNKLIRALGHLGRNIELIIFGSSKPEKANEFMQKTHYMGYLHDDVSMAALYSAADVMVVPSLQEAFGQTASEALACGIPVVAFNATGLIDIISHKKNGYLAKPYDTSDFAEGIKWVLNNKDYEGLRRSAREKVLREFDSRVVAKRYIALYEKILERQSKFK